MRKHTCGTHYLRVSTSQKSEQANHLASGLANETANETESQNTPERRGHQNALATRKLYAQGVFLYLC